MPGSDSSYGPFGVAHPEADVYVDGWTRQNASEVNLYQSIDENVPADDDYVVCTASDVEQVYVTRLSDLVDPEVSIGHIVRYRFSKDRPSGAQVNITVELRQGYVNEASKGTLIASQTHENVPLSWRKGKFLLTEAQADAITDYTQLYLRFTTILP